MAEDKPVVRNKGMLLLAALVGLLTVLLYNFQVQRVRQEARGETIYVMEFTRPVKADEEIDVEEDLVVREYPKQFEGGLGDVVVLANPSEKDMLRNRYMRQAAKPGDFLQYGHISSLASKLPSQNISPGMAVISVPVDRTEVPGDILRVGDYVFLYGVVALPNKKPQTHVLIRNVRVRTVGGKGLEQTEVTKAGLRLADGGQQSYRQISIEVPSDEVLLLNDVLTNVDGGVGVGLVNPDTVQDNTQPRVSEPLRKLSARPGRRSAGF